MQESEIIWKFLSRMYPDDHTAIYLYACGNVRSPSTAMKQIIDNTRKIFCPPLSEAYLSSVVKGFLDMKKKQYINGEIKIKPIY